MHCTYIHVVVQKHMYMLVFPLPHTAMEKRYENSIEFKGVQMKEKRRTSANTHTHPQKLFQLFACVFHALLRYSSSYSSLSTNLFAIFTSAVFMLFLFFYRYLFVLPLCICISYAFCYCCCLNFFYIQQSLYK